MEKITVQKSLLPFSQTFKTETLENCKTVQDVVDRLVPYYFEDCKLIVTLNNETLPQSEWATTVLKEKDIVGCNFVPMGGKGGKTAMQVVTVVAAVAIAIYAPQISAAILGTTLGAAGTAGFGTYALAAGITIAASMTASYLNGTIFALPTQKNKTTSSQSEANVYSISKSNSVDKWGVVPINLGTNRMYPKQAALPYTEIVGDDQYLRQLFTWGYGDVTISELKLGDTAIDNYTDIEMAHRLNSNLNSGTGLFSTSVYQEDLSVELKYNTSQTRTTQSDADEVTLDITFQALTGYDNSGNRYATSVSFKIETKPTSGSTWTTQYSNYTVRAATAKTKRASLRIAFDTQGQYDVRITRLTADSTDDRLINASYWTAIRSVTWTNPVTFANISGTAMRIKGTDQLNGSVDNFNAIVSTKIKSYSPTTDTWLSGIVSSNPADIFRHVLQSKAFAKALPDSKINLEKLKEWWIYCDDNKLSYNRIIDYETSIDEVLNDICASGMATLSKVDNVYSVIIDNERPTIKGLITPRNSWDYEGNITYPDLPHALRIEFRNKDEGYETDERLVYREGYSKSNATLYERLQYDSCTNADLAYWYGKRYFACAITQPETHTFKMDFENMTFNRGDRIVLVNDVILVGVGQGRITSLITDDSGNITGFKIDDMVTIPNSYNFGVRIRDNTNAGYTYHLLKNYVGTSNQFSFATPLTSENAPAIGSLCAFVEDGKELDLIISEIKPGKDNTATITAVNYAPDRFDPIGTIPEFVSNITPAWDKIVPKSPVSGGAVVTDSRGVVKNSDGSYTTTMIIPLINNNDVPVEVSVKLKPVETTIWEDAQYITRLPEQVVLTGLQDGTYYDIKVYYRRTDASQQYSLPLNLNNIQFIGGSDIPADVTGFTVSVLNGIGLFEWNANDDFDLSHYIIKFNNNKTNVEWATSQVVYEKLQGNTVSMPIHEGTYLIKAVDYFGNESQNATTVVSYDSGAFNNVVETLKQDPTWSGTKDGTIIYNTNLRLADGATEGYYYLTPSTFDLSEIYTCLLLSTMSVGIVSRTGESRAVRDITAVRSVGYIRSTDETANWSVELQMKLSNDNETWTDWQTFTASQHTFRYAQFRLYLSTDSLTLTPEVANLSVLIDMPDRYEQGEDIQITTASTGKEVEFDTPFMNVPSVNITVQNGAVDDRLEFVSKTNKGFTIKVFNATLNTYVTRSFDYLAAGYGRLIQ